MNVRTILFLVAVIFGLVTRAEASYFMLSPSSTPLDPNKPIMIVVNGRGNVLNEAPQVAAIAKAEAIARGFPGMQILLISVNESDDPLLHKDPNADDKDLVADRALKSIRFVNHVLDPKELVDQLVKYHQIAGLFFYGHSSIENGQFLDGIQVADQKNYQGWYDIRWLPGPTPPPGNIPTQYQSDFDGGAQRLAGHFTADSFVVFNGCNAGHDLAPYLSKLWGVPVAGALTSSHFEAIAPNDRFVVSNNVLRCGKIKPCYRAKPDDEPYIGHSGTYQGGLPFYRFFCDGTSQTKCERAMALSVLANVTIKPLSPHPTEAQYAQSVADWLCPAVDPTQDAATQLREAGCIDHLLSLNPLDLSENSPEFEYDPFKSGKRVLQCDDTSPTCYVNCKLDPGAISNCAVSRPEPVVSTAFMNEYKKYMEGYALVFGHAALPEKSALVVGHCTTTTQEGPINLSAAWKTLKPVINVLGAP